MTQLFLRSEKLESAISLRDRFQGYSEKRKRLSVKMGKKSGKLSLKSGIIGKIFSHSQY